MITIQNLEVQFEVEGDDKQRFAQLFKEYIRQWTAEAQTQKARELRLARERSLGDRSVEGEHL
jgi:hypothetical protein